MAKRRSVLVVGTGTIGEPFIGLLSVIKERVGIDEIIFHKNSPRLEDRPRIAQLIQKGAKLAVDEEKMGEFKQLGIAPTCTKMEALERVAVVVDCTPKGTGRKNKKDLYEKFEKSALGFIAQGSEFGFGKMYVHGVNDEALSPGKDKYIQVVSCNTHNLAVILHTLALAEGPDNLVAGRFVCMRRDSDISQAGESTPSPEVGDHTDERFGTHHARDAYHLFQTLGLTLNIFSSAVVLNTQYMHTIWFDLQLKRPTTLEKIRQRLAENPRIALTHKPSANLIFSFGRDHGYYGRILNNTVFVLPSLHVSQDGTELRGFCFTPQDGNSLISSVAATLWFLSPENYTEKLNVLNPFCFKEI